MKRALVLTFILAMVAALAAPVAAKPPTDPKKPPRLTHPDGVTCMESTDDFDHPPVEWDADSGPLTVTLTPRASLACIDVDSDVAADYRIEIIDSDSLRKASSWGVKDSQPGDFCDHGGEIDLVDGLTLFDIPASVVDACGTEYTDNADTLVFAVAAGFRGGPGGWVDLRLTRLEP